MRRLFFTALVSFALNVGAVSRAADKTIGRFPVTKQAGGEIRDIGGIPVMILSGTPEEIGTQQGKMVGPFVKPLLNFPRDFLKRNRMDARWPLVVTASKYLLKKTPKSHQQELQAVVKASGLDGDLVAVANTMLELRRMGGCSTQVISKQRSKTGGVLFGRNFDFPPMGVLDKFGVVTIYRPKGKRAFVSVGFPGLLGVISGMNDAGVTVATLDVYRTKDGSPMFDIAGTPMMFTFRRILEECGSVAEAEKLLRKAKHTTWMNLTVCDKKTSRVFEMTPKSVVARKPIDGLLTCTNHFRSEELCTSKECRRFRALLKSDKLAKLGVDDLAKSMHSANQGAWTIQTMIFEPQTLKLHVSLKNPPTSARKLTTIELSPLFKPKSR